MWSRLDDVQNYVLKVRSRVGQEDVQCLVLGSASAFCMLKSVFFGLFSENARISDWSPFTTCSASCGAGLKTRYRTCNKSRFGGKDCSGLGPLFEQQPCNIHECNGEPMLAWPGVRTGLIISNALAATSTDFTYVFLLFLAQGAIGSEQEGVSASW